MVVDDPELKLLRAHAKKITIEEQLFKQNETDCKIFARLPQYEHVSFMQKRLGKDTFGYWFVGFAACGLLMGHTSHSQL